MIKSICFTIKQKENENHKDKGVPSEATQNSSPAIDAALSELQEHKCNYTSRKIRIYNFHMGKRKSQDLTLVSSSPPKERSKVLRQISIMRGGFQTVVCDSIVCPRNSNTKITDIRKYQVSTKVKPKGRMKRVAHRKLDN